MITFKEFIAQEYTPESVEEIMLAHHSENNKMLLYLSRNLVLWTFVGIAIDVLLLSGSGLFALQYGVSVATFAPSLFFLITNFIAKFLYVRWYSKNTTTLAFNLKAIIPYLGPILIIAHLATKNQLYSEAFSNYLKHFKASLNWKNIKFYLKK